MQDNTRLKRNTEKLSVEEINYLYDKGVLFFCTGKFEESIKCFDKIIAINPASKIALGYKGLALLKLKRHQEAVRCYEKALTC
jgi:tetratricopeptide (TPR) repeat protein